MSFSTSVFSWQLPEKSIVFIFMIGDWLGGLLVLYTYNTRHALQAKIYAIFIVCMHDRPCHVYYLFLEDVIMDSWA